MSAVRSSHRELQSPCLSLSLSWGPTPDPLEQLEHPTGSVLDLDLLSRSVWPRSDMHAETEHVPPWLGSTQTSAQHWRREVNSSECSRSSPQAGLTVVVIHHYHHHRRHPYHFVVIYHHRLLVVIGMAITTVHFPSGIERGMWSRASHAFRATP